MTTVHCSALHSHNIVRCAGSQLSPLCWFSACSLMTSCRAPHRVLAATCRTCLATAYRTSTTIPRSTSTRSARTSSSVSSCCSSSSSPTSCGTRTAATTSTGSTPVSTRSRYISQYLLDTRQYLLVAHALTQACVFAQFYTIRPLKQRAIVYALGACIITSSDFNLQLTSSTRAAAATTPAEVDLAPATTGSKSIIRTTGFTGRHVTTSTSSTTTQMTITPPLSRRTASTAPMTPVSTSFHPDRRRSTPAV